MAAPKQPKRWTWRDTLRAATKPSSEHYVRADELHRHLYWLDSETPKRLVDFVAALEGDGYFVRRRKLDRFKLIEVLGLRYQDGPIEFPHTDPDV